MRTHPRRKNKDAPRMGHPEFHAQRVGNTGGGLIRNKIPVGLCIAESKGIG
jgi:hypothetical protein